jgi:hypothetical protein
MLFCFLYFVVNIKAATYDANLVAWYKMNDKAANTTVINSKGETDGVSAKNTILLSSANEKD